MPRSVYEPKVPISLYALLDSRSNDANPMSYAGNQQPEKPCSASMNWPVSSILILDNREVPPTFTHVPLPLSARRPRAISVVAGSSCQSCRHSPAPSHPCVIACASHPPSEFRDCIRAASTSHLLKLHRSIAMAKTRASFSEDALAGECCCELFVDPSSSSRRKSTRSRTLYVYYTSHQLQAPPLAVQPGGF